MKSEGSDGSRAEQLKLRANESFKAHKFAEAIELYSQAIELNGKEAVYWANRALAHFKLEEYGSAMEDATKAIELDPKYSKGYYRRGDAYFAMGKFKDAHEDFLQVRRLCPNEPDALKKLNKCVAELNSEKAISVPESGSGPVYSFASTKVTDVASAVSIILMVVVVVYMSSKSTAGFLSAGLVTVFLLLGPCWWNRFNLSFLPKSKTVELGMESRYSDATIEGDFVTLDFVKKMMDDFKNQKSLQIRYAYQIVLQTKEMLKSLPSLVDIEIPEGKHFTVCGDVHGQFYDLLNIFELNGLPSEDNPYLFNGDFVDRGSFSVEVILTLFALKCMCPSGMYLSRGNHESKSMNKIYGFESEIFVVHGGLFSVDGVKLSDIKAIDRFCEPPEQGLMCEMLWSDPRPQLGRGPSKRGVGLSFGGDVTKRFLAENNLDLIVRSHEVKDEGYEIAHNGKLITVFSAPNYCDQLGNKGAFIQFHAPDLNPNIVTFAAVPHPNVRPMAYADSFFQMFS